MNPILNYRVDDPAMAEEISAGDVVRSYDFETNMNCYVDGVVKEILPAGHGDFPYPRYRIRCLRRVFDGKELPNCEGRDFFPPVNGTRHSFGGYTNGVRKVAKARK